MTTRQAAWKFLANLGDASPLDYGGLFLYQDETGVYAPELEKLEEPEEGSKRPYWTIYRVCLDKCKLYQDDDTLYFVPDAYEPSWPHPARRYQEWYADSLADVAETVGSTTEELKQAFCSNDLKERAWAYQCVYGYHGWENGDSYPIRLTRAEVEARYTRGEL